MKSSVKASIEDEIQKLTQLGVKIYWRLYLESTDITYDDPPIEEDDSYDVGEYQEYLKSNSENRDKIERLRKASGDIDDFSVNYEKFYTLSLKIVKSLSPERLDDFVKQYKDEKRKVVSVANYLISDAIVGYKHTYGNYDRSSALPRLKTQISILKAIKDNISNLINDIDTLVRADLFDSELESAAHLLSRGHGRASGAVAGVVLETHLANFAERHGYNSRKKHSTIADYNEFLKSEGIIEITTWRRIQSLGDIRNLCDHQKAGNQAKKMLKI